MSFEPWPEVFGVNTFNVGGFYDQFGHTYYFFQWPTFLTICNTTSCTRYVILLHVSKRSRYVILLHVSKRSRYVILLHVSIHSHYVILLRVSKHSCCVIEPWLEVFG